MVISSTSYSSIVAEERETEIIEYIFCLNAKGIYIEF